MSGTIFLLVAVAIVGFLVVMTPIVFLVNKAIGSSFEREAAALRASLRDVTYAEDDVPLRITGVAPLAFGIRWRRADIRSDRHALYVMQYNRQLGVRMGQPNLRVTWAREAGSGGFVPAAIMGEPRLDGDAVVVPVELRMSTLWLRIKARDPRALLDALNGMR